MAPNSPSVSSSSSPSSTSSRNQPKRSKTISVSSADPPSPFPSPFPQSKSTSFGHPLKHSTTLPSSQSANLRTTVLRSRTVVVDSPQQRSGFIDAGSGKEVEAKVVLLGTQSVGKTSFIHRYCRREFRTGTESTISANISTRKNYVQGVKVKLQIWDTAGGERFRGMAELYYRHANVAILLYDVTNRQTFLDLQDWIKELKDKTQTDTIIHVVGSKVDLKSSVNGEAIDLPYARRQLRSWLQIEPPPLPPAPPVRPTMPTPTSSRFGFSVSSRPQPLPPTTSPSIIAPSAGEFFPETTFSRTSSTTRERRQSGDWAGSISSAELLDRPGHERRQSSRRRSEEWGRSTGGSEERRGASQAALGQEEEIRVNGLQVEDGVDGIRLWECSSLKNQGIDEIFQYITHQLILRGDRIQKEKERRDRESVMLVMPPPTANKTGAGRECCSV